MKSIRIQNLRSLKNTGIVEISPITVLVGENSSGKSSFLRAFPLIRQSYEVSSSGPILWYGKYVDFGSFSESVNTFSDKKEINFAFDFGKTRIPYKQMQVLSEDVEKFNLKLNIRIVSDLKREARTDRLELQLEDNFIETEFSNDGMIAYLKINKNDAGNLLNTRVIQSGGLVPHFLISNDKLVYSPNRLMRRFNEGMLADIFKNYVHHKTEIKTIHTIYENISIGSSIKMLESMKNIPRSTSTTWANNVNKWDINSDDFVKLRDKLIFYNAFRLFDICNEELSNFAQSIRYIAPLRATAERYYRIQNLAVDEVDYQGQNLPMFLRNLTETERRRFSAWSERLFGFSPQPSSSGGHTSIFISQGDGPKYNITDMGFGFSQLLPIITQLWQLSQKRIIRKNWHSDDTRIIFTVEQPELHLHPRMQSKLAIAFSTIIKQARADGIDLRIILETHSETILNTFGNLLIKNELNQSDINIILFEKKDSNRPSKVTISKFDENGYLTNWPYGFFNPDWV